jgi:rubrerythrin
MEKSTQMGANRTGIDTSPFDSKTMMEGAENFFSTGGSDRNMKTFKREFLGDVGTLGSVPLPGTPKGILKSTMKKISGHNPEMFINKLGERLAFERSGVRIYESFIEKCVAASANGEASSTIDIARLREFCDQEAEHFHMVTRCLLTLGADPTAQTPDADAAGVSAMGMIKVIGDPRTSISQSLAAMLSIELTDHAAWDLLIKLAEDMGQDDMAAEFSGALQQEEIHLTTIREWYEFIVRDQAQMH